MFASPPKDAPKVTCEICRVEYVDWEDWSGPAHSMGDCFRNVVKLVPKLTAERDEALLKLAKAETQIVDLKVQLAGLKGES